MANKNFEIKNGLTVAGTERITSAGVVTGTTTTQAASDNTTKLASTAYVTTALANLSDSAPSTLNTLNELAAALGDDANYATTTTNAIAAKLPLAGGTLTGGIVVGGDSSINRGNQTSGELLIGGTTDGGFVDFDGTSIQLNTQRDPNTGTFINTSKSHGGITIAGASADSHIKFYTASANNTTATERMRINKDGDVSIGSDAPGAKLEIRDGGNDYTSGIILRKGSSTSETTTLYHDNSSATTTVLANRYGSDNARISLLLKHASGSPVNALTAMGTGKVGVNQNTPAYTLDVDGDINFTGKLREDGNELNVSTLHSYDIEYLVIAGGGQGGDQHGGGGGAGGYRNSYASETSGRGSSGETPITTATGVTYTCTVGAGATTSHPGSGADGANGSNSSIAATGLTTISCTGGGGGAGHADGGASGNNGGCGGGSGLTGSGGDGVAAQGYDGGDNPGSGNASWPNTGAGGGGAGAAGGDGNANSNGDQNGWGGTGLSSSITGSAVVRAGGGGGGSHAPHTPATGSNHLGGPGGGGQGGVGNSTSTHGANGTDGKGGGGGGSNGAGQTCGGGGDGVVILRVPTSNYSGVVSGSPTVTTSGSSTIITFTGTGTYTS